MFDELIKTGQITAVNAFICKENINKLFEDNGFTGEIGVLSIDIDGNDYHVWEAIDVVSPRIVVIEYNAKFPPDCEWVINYDPKGVYSPKVTGDRYGASLKSYEKLAERKGYVLVGTNITGYNAFFVRKDLWSEQLFPSPPTAENLYNPHRPIFFGSGYTARSCLLTTTISYDGLCEPSV